MNHSGAFLFKVLSNIFDTLCTAWKDNIICSSTNGVPDMVGLNIGFTEQRSNFSIGSKFYQFWGLAHQLGIIIKAGLHAISESGYFTFVKVLASIIIWLWRQDMLIRRMGIKRPYYINIWWNYFSKVLKWLL